MKNANELSEITMKTSETIKWLENEVANEMEKAAAQGKDYCNINTDDCPESNKFSRNDIIEKCDKYLSKFGYKVSGYADKKRFQISW